MLPDMRHFMDKPVPRRRVLARKVVLEALLAEVDFAVGRHRDVGALEAEPQIAAPMDFYAGVIDRIAENQSREGDFTGAERPRFVFS
jgi:hypothetical protein